MAPTSRRRALQSIGTCLGLGLGGCLGTPSGGTGTGTDAPTSTDTSTPAGATPRYSPLVLEIRNRTDEVLLVGVTLTEWTDASATGSPGDVLYDETVEMASPETLDLKPYRIDAAMHFRLSRVRPCCSRTSLRRTGAIASVSTPRRTWRSRP